MATRTGSFDVSAIHAYSRTPYNVIQIRVNYKEVTDDVANTSTMSVESVQMSSDNGQMWFLDGYIKCNGAVIATLNDTDQNRTQVTVPGNRTFTTISNVQKSPVTVTHNADGTGLCTFTFAKNHDVYITYEEYRGIKARAWTSGYQDMTFPNPNKAVTLTTIPRASTLSVGNGTLGTANSLTINRASSSFNHTITYSCGSASGTVVSDTSNTVISFTPPLSLASQNTTGKTVTVTYTLTTKNGSTVIGTSTATATYTIPSSAGPSVASGWATLAPYNTGTAAAGINAYVQGYSKAEATFNSSKITTQYGATISSYKLEISGTAYTTSPYRSGVLSSSGNITAKCTVTDSRGYSASQSFTITVNQYSNPTLSNISVYRCTSSGAETPGGTYLYVKATANISSIGGLNSYTLRVRYKQTGGSYGSYTTLASGTGSIIGGGLITITHSYIVEISLVDSLGNTVLNTTTIETDSVAFNVRDGGHGAAFDKYAEDENTLALPANWVLKIGNTTLSQAQLQALLNLL